MNWHALTIQIGSEGDVSQPDFPAMSRVGEALREALGLDQLLLGGVTLKRVVDPQLPQVEPGDLVRAAMGTTMGIVISIDDRGIATVSLIGAEDPRIARPLSSGSTWCFLEKFPVQDLVIVRKGVR